eukprot:3858828-Heterocapsa_arctica.AAC.1
MDKTFVCRCIQFIEEGVLYTLRVSLRGGKADDDKDEPSGTMGQSFIQPRAASGSLWQPWAAS